MADVRLYCALVLAVCLVQPCHLHLVKDETGNHGNCSGKVNFRSPVSCQPPDCDFTVAWVDSGLWVNFSLTAAVGPSNTSVWAAVGFSGDTLMGDTDVIACCIDNQGRASIHDGWNVPKTHTIETDPNQDGLLLTSAQISNGKLHCSFSRQKDTGDHKQDKPLNQPWHILAAMGRIYPDSQMLKHSQVAVSHCECDVTLCEQNCGCRGNKMYLLELHGAVMALVFVFFLPTGALLSRYYQAVFSAWFKGHVIVMVTGVILAVVGLALVLTHTRGTFTVGVHQIVGIVCLTLAVIQPVYGFLRPPVGPSLKRRVFKVVHRLLAVSILILGAVALYLGSYLFHSPVFYWIVAALSLAIVTDLCFMLLLEFITRSHTTYSLPVGYHKVTKEDELSDSEEEEEVYMKEGLGGGEKNLRLKMVTEKKQRGTFVMEKTICALFAMQSLSFAVFVGVMIIRYGTTCSTR